MPFGGWDQEGLIEAPKLQVQLSPAAFTPSPPAMSSRRRKKVVIGGHLETGTTLPVGLSQAQIRQAKSQAVAASDRELLRSRAAAASHVQSNHGAEVHASGDLNEFEAIASGADANPITSGAELAEVSRQMGQRLWQGGLFNTRYVSR